MHTQNINTTECGMKATSRERTKTNAKQAVRTSDYVTWAGCPLPTVCHWPSRSHSLTPAMPILIFLHTEMREMLYLSPDREHATRSFRGGQRQRQRHHFNWIHTCCCPQQQQQQQEGVKATALKCTHKEKREHKEIIFLKWRRPAFPPLLSLSLSQSAPLCYSGNFFLIKMKLNSI